MGYICRREDVCLSLFSFGGRRFRCDLRDLTNLYYKDNNAVWVHLQVVYVVAKNAVQKGVPALEGGEMLCTHLRPLEEARSDILAGMPTDGILLTGLWYLEHS